MTKAVIIGAGIGGLACGALLAKAGYEVEVLERNSFVGGRCSAEKRDGFTVDHFVHAFATGSQGPHARVARALGEELTFISRDPTALVVDGRGGRFRRYHQRRDIRPLLTRARMALDMGIKPAHYLGGFRLFRDLLRADDAFIEERDRTTMRDFLLSYTKDEQLHRFFNVLSHMYFGISYDRSSAGEFVWCFRGMFNAADFGYVKGSSGAIPAAYRRGLEKHGGVLRLRTPVEKILTDGGRVTGVSTPGGEIRADLVISNAGIPTTVKLVGEEAVGSDYARFASGLKYTDGSLVVRFFLDRPVLKDPFLVYVPDLSSERMFADLEEGGLPSDPWIFMPVIDLWDPDLVPPGSQLALVGTAAPLRADQAACEELAEMIERRLYAIYPEMKEHVTSREVVGPGYIQAVSGHAGGGGLHRPGPDPRPGRQGQAFAGHSGEGSLPGGDGRWGAGHRHRAGRGLGRGGGRPGGGEASAVTSGQSAVPSMPPGGR